MRGHHTSSSIELESESEPGLEKKKKRNRLEEWESQDGQSKKVDVVGWVGTEDDLARVWVAGGTPTSPLVDVLVGEQLDGDELRFA